MRALIISATTLFTILVAATPSSAGQPQCDTKGDGNGDCRIAFDDFMDFAACMTGPGAASDPVCACYDENDDGDTDLRDFAHLQAVFTGSQLIPGCEVAAGPFEPGTLHVPPAASRLEGRGNDTGLITQFQALMHCDDPGVAGGGGNTGFSGELHHSAIDLHIPGRGVDFIWARKYRSKVGPDTAQGVGWDSSYNVYLEQDGLDLILHDGNTRFDRYFLVSGVSGTYWCSREFFREITQEPDTSYVCRFAQRGEWRFHPFDGSPAAGRLTAIVDANGNTLSFAYDGSGRLSTITDTLNRDITVAYNPDGRIEAVTDFAGRQVQYQYYTDADVDGSAGDLKSVTSPAVTGTPNGNDFPAGKTVTYTYSTGFSEEALNHNLLTITDGRGQTYLVNEYAATLDPAAPDFDRLTRQILGGPDDIIDYVYVPETPDAANGYAVIRTVINDREGHVNEYLYDGFNRCVAVLAYTGQADPDQPTTDVDNRPTGKLRAEDPDFFETRFEYNDEALVTRVLFPALDELELVYEADLDFFAPPRKKANLLSSTRMPGPRGGDQTEIVEQFEYDDGLNFDTNQITRAVDGRGNETVHEYDAAGNRIHTTHRIPSIVEDFEYNAFGQLTAHIHPDNGSGHRRRDEFTYYTTGPQTGYLENAIVDAPGQALTTTYEYDSVGNVTRVIDARGNDKQYAVNQLNQVVRVTSREPGPTNPDRYERDLYYDENNNIVQVDVQNRDESGALPPNSHLTTVYEYDILDRCISQTEEVDPGHSVVTEYEYDADSNRTLVRSGEATNGNQPTSVIRTFYDERDLVFQVVSAEGDPQQSTTQYDYDANGNLIRVTQGWRPTPVAERRACASMTMMGTIGSFRALIPWATSPLANTTQTATRRPGVWMARFPTWPEGRGTSSSPRPGSSTIRWTASRRGIVSLSSTRRHPSATA